MPLILAQPWGLLALLGIPLLIFVHMLRHRPREVTVTTAFLLDAIAPEVSRGRRVDRLVRTWQLLAQLLAVLVATWLLVDPRFAPPTPRAEVAVVLDASASMQAFRPEVEPALAELLDDLGPPGAIALTVLSSDPTAPPLATRAGPGALSGALDRWRPELGAHDPQEVLRRARARVGTTGAVVWVTDHPPAEGQAAQDILHLAVGRPLDDVGFTSGAVDAAGRWRASVRNHGAVEARRTLSVGGTSRPLTLAPGAARTVEGALPEGADAVSLALTPDAWTVDDRLVLVRPRAAPLRVHVAPEVPAWVGDLFAAQGLRVEEPAMANLLVVGGTAPVDRGPAAPARLFLLLDDLARQRKPQVGVVAEDHPLVAELPWPGLVYPRPPRAEAGAPGTPLLWAGDRPVVTLAAPDDLHVRIDVRGSNAARHPGFLLLLTRFAREVQRRQPDPTVVNVEVGSPLEARAAPSGGPVRVESEAGARTQPASAPLTAPWTPGRFTVTQGSRRLVSGAAHFADVREADLTAAGAHRPDPGAVARVARRAVAPDPYRSVWLLLLLGLALVSFWLGRGGEGAA